MSSFDEFLAKRGYIRGYNHDYQIAYDFGSQSRQAEIDELKKRIEGALFELEQLHLLKTTNSNNAIKILKGETHES